MAAQPKSVRDQIIAMFLKIAAKTITREEGTLLLNDLVRVSTDKSEVRKIILDLCQTPPKDVYVKTIFHTVALARNQAFTKILEIGLEHKSEETSIVAADGLSSLGNEEARNALVTHLINDSYHVRKASGDVLIKGWGREGVKLVTSRGLTHPEVYYRYTAASSLARAGKMGIAALLELFGSNDMNAIQSASEALSEAKNALEKEDVPKLTHALGVAVGCKHSNAVISLLKLLGVMKEKVEGFEEQIAVLLNYDYEPVRTAAKNALVLINTVKARELLSSTHKDERQVVHLSAEDNEEEDYWTR